GARVAVHCVGGLGRSGLVAACFLKSRGASTDEAIVEVRRVRSPRAVESAVQEQFVTNFHPR
ncbi:MAG TPA: protein-tyrosine-phosphatase, partial [Elusimicrobiota bacterium]|nr:protein-tyrosine-phosphatase [Elusimicrobiota bacterium]